MSTLFIRSLSSQGKLQDGSQEEGNYGLQLINGHLPGLQRLGRRVFQGHSFTSSINIAAWSLTSVFRLFLQVLQEKRDLLVCGMGECGEVAEEKRKMKGYRLSQVRLIFLLSQEVWRDYTLRTVSTALLWKHVFPKSSALLMAPLQESRRWACTPCKCQVWVTTWQLPPAPLAAAQVSPPWHLPAKSRGLLEPQQRLRLCRGADVGTGLLLLASRTALPAAGKSNHWQR